MWEILTAAGIDPTDHPVRRTPILGGLINEYNTAPELRKTPWSQAESYFRAGQEPLPPNTYVRRVQEWTAVLSRWCPTQQDLKLAQGRLDDAAAAIHRTAAETEGAVERSRVLAAYVEIKLAAGDIDAARTAVDELEKIAADFDSPHLRAVVEYARGSVLLAEGDAAAACPALRRAWVAWHELEAAYGAARVRLQMARACSQLSDHDTAQRELDAARRVFEQLGTVPALAQVRELLGRATYPSTGGLTPREVEVLRLVATGATNREIADSLVISDKTVARHVSNMFTKLGLSSRAAATAYAYEHELV